MPGTNAIYDEHDPEDLPPELQPLPDVEWSELSSRAVQRLVDKLPDEMLADVPGDSRLVKGVLAEGIGVHFDGEVVPTVAGLAIYGRRPTDWLPGMRLSIVVDGGVPNDAVGSAGRLLRHLVGHPVGKRLGQPASRALVGFALAWRSWEDELREEGLVLNLNEGVLSLYVPGSVSGEVTNPVIAELLWRTGVLPKRKASLKSLDRMLEAVAPEGVVVESDGDSTAFRWRLELPTAQVDEGSDERPTGIRATARCTNPEPQSPRPIRAAARCAKEERDGSEVSNGETGRFTIGRAVEGPQEAVRPDGYRSADDRQADLIRTLRNHGRMSRRQLQERLGWTRSTLRDVLRAAVEAGNVAKLAPHPRSPFQVYEVVERRPNHPRPPAGTRWASLRRSQRRTPRGGWSWRCGCSAGGRVSSGTYRPGMMRGREPTRRTVGEDRFSMSNDKDEYEIIADVLVAVVNGPFCVDGEFQTITGVSLAEVEAVLKDWPAVPPERERHVVWTVERCLWAILTYPNPLREEAWPFWLDVSPSRVESLMRKWRRRRDRIGSPWGKP